MKCAALPNRAYCVNDKFCRQVETGRKFCLAGRAAAQGFAEGVELLRPCRCMNGAVYTAAAPQLVIGCVDDSVYFQFGDVAADKSYRHNGYSYAAGFSSCAAFVSRFTEASLTGKVK